MMTSDDDRRPLSNWAVVRMRKDVLMGVVAPACPGPSAVATAAGSLDNIGRWFRKSFRAEGVMPGNAAITSGGAISTSTLDDPLKTVPNGTARSANTAGRRRT